MTGVNIPKVAGRECTNLHDKSIPSSGCLRGDSICPNTKDEHLETSGGNSFLGYGKRSGMEGMQ